MFPGITSFAPVSGYTNFTTSNSIGEMNQADKVALANQIANSEIASSSIPGLNSEFVNDAEVQSILVTAMLKGVDIGEGSIQAMKDPACIAAISPENQASIIADTSQWHAALRDKPTMVVAIKFFENLDAKNTIMDSMGKLSIANACLNGVLDAAYVPLLSDAKEVFRTQHLTVHAESQSTHQEVVTSTAVLGPEKEKLLKLEADTPNDQNVKDLRAAFNLKAALHNAKIDQSEQLEKTALALEKSRNQLQGFIDLLTGQTTQIENPNFYMSETELAAQKAAFMAQFSFMNFG